MTEKTVTDAPLQPRVNEVLVVAGATRVGDDDALAPQVCESCRRRPAPARPTWTRQHGDRFLCSACAMGY